MAEVTLLLAHHLRVARIMRKREQLESGEQYPQTLHLEYKVTTFPLIQLSRVKSGYLRVKLSSVTEKLGSVFTYLSFVIGTFSAAQNELNAVNCLLLSSS